MLNSTDFIRFISLIRKNDKCTCCDESSWIVYGPQSTGNSEFTTGAIGAVMCDKPGQIIGMLVGGVPVFRMECQNCGNMMLYSYDVVSKRLASLDKK